MAEELHEGWDLRRENGERRNSGASVASLFSIDGECMRNKCMGVWVYVC